MNSRRHHEQIGLFHTIPPVPGTAEIDAIRAEAVRARDAAIAAMLGRAFAGIGRTLATIGSVLVAWPQRRATYESLRMLSDRELSDIGLSRGDIARVFEPDFRMPAKAANRNAPALSAKTQAA